MKFYTQINKIFMIFFFSFSNCSVPSENRAYLEKSQYKYGYEANQNWKLSKVWAQKNKINSKKNSNKSVLIFYEFIKLVLFWIIHLKNLIFNSNSWELFIFNVYFKNYTRILAFSKPCQSLFNLNFEDTLLRNLNLN